MLVDRSGHKELLVKGERGLLHKCSLDFDLVGDLGGDYL